jgi:enterochelin esterase-like enzyme
MPERTRITMSRMSPETMPGMERAMIAALGTLVALAAVAMVATIPMLAALPVIAALPTLAQAQPASGGAEGGMCQALISPKIDVLAAKLAKAGAKGQAKVVDQFRAENAGGFPLVEDSLVTFVYIGKVALRACVPSDLNGWDTKGHEMSPLGEADLYYRTLKLPPDARIDYKFYVDNAWMLDPLNSRTVKGGFGDNSAFGMPAYVEPAEIAQAEPARRGTIVEHDFASKLMGNTRKVRVYLPAGFRGVATSEIPNGGGSPTESVDLRFASTYPVVFVQDGGEYLTLASMANVLDNLIARGVIPPVVGVFIDPMDRNYEYYLNTTYERMIIEEIVPFMRQTYDITREPAKTAIIGASLGGEIAVMIAVDHPEVFGKCGSQSGAFAIEDNQLINTIKRLSKKPVDIYLDCGTFEDLLSSNRTMRDALAAKGYRVRYQEFNEGHSWGNWRAHIDDMLTFFWGPQK